jgi:Co/Zn/Cd efflux system component
LDRTCCILSALRHIRSVDADLHDNRELPAGGARRFAALVANGGVALMLYRSRSGDANLRSVWIFSRNDALGNLAVLLAAVGVFGTGTGWPDVMVASITGALGLWGGWQIISQARSELRTERQAHVVMAAE